MKYCENCGAQLENDATFCDECGTSQGVQKFQKKDSEKPNKKKRNKMLHAGTKEMSRRAF